MEKIRQKIGTKTTGKTTDKNSVAKPKKKTRYISIGWLSADKDCDYRYVRAAYGGGTRRIAVEKSATCFDVLRISTELHFPNGRSSEILLSDFDVDLLDFSRNTFHDMGLTVQKFMNFLLSLIFDFTLLQDTKIHQSLKMMKNIYLQQLFVMNMKVKKFL